MVVPSPSMTFTSSTVHCVSLMTISLDAIMDCTATTHTTSSEQTCLEGKDCHCTHLAHAGTRINYRYYTPVAAQLRKHAN